MTTTRKLRAAVVATFGKPFVIGKLDAPSPGPGPGQILVRTEACGVFVTTTCTPPTAVAAALGHRQHIPGPHTTTRRRE